jgi:hypothetical protein
MVSPWGLGSVSAVAEEDARVASRRRTVVTLKGWGPTVQRIDRDGGNNEKSTVYQHLSSRFQLRESWQRFPSILGYSLARFRWCGGCDLGSWTDKQWMTLTLQLFENLDCSRKPSTSTAYPIGKELMLRDRRDWQLETKLIVTIQLDFYEERKG